MSQEPKVTRFGADPTVDQELATKAYVDSSGGGSSLAYLMCAISNSNASNTLLFYPFNYFATGVGQTEVTSQIALDTAITLIRTVVNIRNNSHNADSLFAFRDDTVSVASVTVGSGLTGIFNSGAISVAVVAGSLCNLSMDTSASVSGSIRFNVMIVGFQPT